jgi:hypothetical protein
MFEALMQKPPRRCRPTNEALRSIWTVIVRAALVMATLMLFALMSVTASHAHQPENGSTPHIVKRAPQVSVTWAMSATVVKGAINNDECCSYGSGRCCGLPGANSCCHACSTILLVAVWNCAPGLFLRTDIPQPSQIPLASIGANTEFRPPRNIF